MIGSQAALRGPTAYGAIAGAGARPQELMVMGLDRARSLLLQAEKAIAADDRLTKVNTLHSALAIIEFLLGVSGSEPGLLSERLATIYKFVMTAILKGNANNDGTSVAAGRHALDEMAILWRKTFPDIV